MHTHKTLTRAYTLCGDTRRTQAHRRLSSSTTSAKNRYRPTVVLHIPANTIFPTLKNHPTFCSMRSTHTYTKTHAHTYTHTHPQNTRQFRIAHTKPRAHNIRMLLKTHPPRTRPGFRDRRTRVIGPRSVSECARLRATLGMVGLRHRNRWLFRGFGGNH